MIFEFDTTGDRFDRYPNVKGQQTFLNIELYGLGFNCQINEGNIRKQIDRNPQVFVNPLLKENGHLTN